MCYYGNNLENHRDFRLNRCSVNATKACNYLNCILALGLILPQRNRDDQCNFLICSFHEESAVLAKSMLPRGHYLRPESFNSLLREVDENI